MTLLAVAGGCAVLSTPLAPVNLPFWLLRAGRAVVRGDRRELGFAVALVAALASVVVFTRGTGATTDLAISGVGSVTITFRTWWIHTVSRVAGLLLPKRSGMPSAADYGVAAVIGVLVIAVAFVGRLRNLPPLLVSVYFALTSIALELAGRHPVDLPNIYQMPVRCTVYPAAMLLLTLVVTLDGLPRGYGRAAATVAVMGLLAWAWAPSFVIPPFLDQNWPRYAPMVERALRDQCPPHPVVPMNPQFAPLKVNWGPFYREDLAPEQVVAMVGPRTTFHKSFEPRCDHLAEVDLYLGGPTARTPDALVLTVMDATTSIVSATVTPPPAGTNSWEPLCFDPIDSTHGRPLTVVLRGISEDPNARVAVFGHPGGEGSLRYGCRMSPSGD